VEGPVQPQAIAEIDRLEVECADHGPEQPTGQLVAPGVLSGLVVGVDRDGHGALLVNA
jgi:hypothetical protein